LGLPEGIRFFKDLLHKDNGEAMVNHSFAKIREVKYLLGEYNRVGNGYWTKENCIEEAKKYNNALEWRNNSSSCYTYAVKNNWVEECTEHMDELRKPNGYWTKERCIEEAKKYNTVNEWQKNSSTYVNARKNNWLEECTEHMEKTRKPIGWWTLERCIEEAKKYKNSGEFRKCNSACYDKVVNNGWLKECAKHMNLRKPLGYWTLERCVKEAKKYTGVVDLKRNNSGCYSAAQKNGWMSECKKYFKK